MLSPDKRFRAVFHAVKFILCISLSGVAMKLCYIQDGVLAFDERPHCVNVRLHAPWPNNVEFAATAITQMEQQAWNSRNA
eukprot:1850389-Rhodomonas_salina.3